jgi:predicted N-formylglutamate amidohydrolase
MRQTPSSSVVTCEHASNRVPARYRNLGLSPRRLQEHIAWDPGAAILARILARRLQSPLHLGCWSRLVIDLNRGLDHEKLIAAKSFGIAIPGNAILADAEFVHRVEKYYAPYRDAATGDILRALRRSRTCHHWSVHSFTPVVEGVVRDCDIGLLYDPARPRERALAQELRPLLAAHGLRVRMNYPYKGTSDGFTTQLRKRLPASRYLAFELETNQRLVLRDTGARALGKILAGAIATVLSAGTPPVRR